MLGMNRSTARRSAGFTLMEMLVAIVIAAILITAAVPSFVDAIKNNATTGQANELVGLLKFARSEAIRRNRPVTVSIGGLPGEEAGWKAVVSDGGSILREISHGRIRLSAPIETEFDRRGRTAPQLLFMTHAPIEDCSHRRQRRRIDIFPSGEIAQCQVMCGEQACVGAQPQEI